MSDYLTIPQVAEELGISRASAYRLIAKLKLKITDVGTGNSPRARVSRAALASCLAKRESHLA